MSGVGQALAAALPVALRATDQWGLPVLTYPRAVAIRKRYAALDPEGFRAVLPFDLDHDDACRWRAQALPEPTVTMRNPDNERSHVLYGLKHPVRIGAEEERKSERWAEAIKACMAVRLDADRFYSGVFVKSPWCPQWRVQWGATAFYTLGELAAHVPEAARWVRLRGEDLTGMGRNCATFDAIRFWAYARVRERKKMGVTCSQWIDELARECWLYSLREHEPALGERECRDIGHSIGKWTWRKFNDRAFSERQARRGRKGGRPGLGKPWEALGIPKSTYYWRRAHGWDLD